MSRPVVAVSPHLDDAVFSAGATLAALAAQGCDVRVVTAFTRSVLEPTGFALACQTDKGLAAGVDYMALRRAEDVEALRRLGLPPPVHLPFAEAPHRGYASAAELFAGVCEEDDTGLTHELAEALSGHLEGADLVLAPLGLGAHVDHLLILAALGSRALVRWHDLPYALREPASPQASSFPPATAFLQRKLDACAAYATQLDFQFGGETAMRSALAALPERFDAPLP